MKIFSYLYQKMMAWSKHPRAPYYLYGLSFLESSLFPIPPDVMLAPMVLANPARGWRYATGTTVASVLGGLLGYAMGWFFMDIIFPYLQALGYEHAYHQVVAWFKVWGFWVIFVAGFAPIPYKLFTIAGGAMGMGLIPFIIGSTVGRGGRFFLVTGLMLWGGEHVHRIMNEYVERLGWIVLVLVIGIYYTVHELGLGV
jgi:membrane protein YqaA with SNARE-associated domain